MIQPGWNNRLHLTWFSKFRSLKRKLAWPSFFAKLSVARQLPSHAAGESWRIWHPQFPIARRGSAPFDGFSKRVQLGSPPGCRTRRFCPLGTKATVSDPAGCSFLALPSLRAGCLTTRTTPMPGRSLSDSANEDAGAATLACRDTQLPSWSPTVSRHERGDEDGAKSP